MTCLPLPGYHDPMAHSLPSRGPRPGTGRGGGGPVVTRFGCGCTVNAEPDVNGIAPSLEHCRVHAAAPEMAALLKALVDADEYEGDAGHVLDTLGDIARKSRTLLARLEAQ